MIKSLRRKFILVSMALVFVVLAAVFTAQCLSAVERTENNIQMRLQMGFNYRETAGRTIQFGDYSGRSMQATFAWTPSFSVAVVPGNGYWLLHSEGIELTDAQLTQLIDTALAQSKKEGFLKQDNVAYAIRDEMGWQHISFVDVYQDVTALRSSLVGAVVTFLVILACFFGISLVLSRSALRPVEAAWAQQRRFVADASHELRTPLTVILANADILAGNQSETVASQMKWIDNTQAEATRMKWLVDSLLFLAKTDEGKMPIGRDAVNLSDVALSMALTLDALAFERGLILDTAQVAPEAIVLGDEKQLRQLLALLLDNAIKYASEGSTVTIALSTRQSKATLSVHNWGEPLDEAMQAKLFDRFFRADQSRAKEGYGLGLSIAQSIATTHGGKISVASTEATGTTFTVSLPLA